ncbi:MAG TPA: type II secretion system F family protein [Candidatus Limnocylindria bacterium]|nr:type II secretion system F family protein [Candidatus Limnocylindria bacterium]
MFEALPISVFGGAAVFAFALAAAGALDAPGRRRRARLRQFVVAERVAGPSSEVRSAFWWFFFLARIGQPLARAIGLRPSRASERLLRQAGAPTEMLPAELVSARTGGALLSGVWLALLASMLALETPLILGALAVGAAIGFTLPVTMLERRARGRRTEILRALPSALDLLALCADAGLGLDAAIREVTRRWDNLLTAELRRVQLELQVGRDRSVALRELARRTGLPEIRRFTSAVVQADALGLPLARALSDIAAELRTARRQRAEEAARKAPIKMLFPMVLLILPALFIVILGPAVPRLMEVFNVGP